MSKCTCGKDAHPQYNGKCEDCWVDLYPSSANTSLLYDRKSDNGSCLGGTRYIGTGYDRHWNRPKEFLS